MAELVQEEKSSKVFIKTSIDNNTDNPLNILKIDVDYSNSVPSNDAASVLFNVISLYVKEEIFSHFVANIPQLGEIGLEFITEEDGLKIQISTISIVESVAASKVIKLAVESTEAGKFVLAAGAKANFLAAIGSTIVSLATSEMISYEITKAFYNHEENFKNFFDKLKDNNSDYVVIDASRKQMDEVKKYIYYSGILNDKNIKNIYVKNEDGIHKVLKSSSSEYKAIIQELIRRGYEPEQIIGTNRVSYFANLTELVCRLGFNPTETIKELENVA